MGSKFLAKKTLLASSISAVIASGGVVAQSGPVLEEILVTATKRNVSLQDVPLSVTAVTGADLTAMGIESLPDIEKAVPGLKIRYVGSNPSIIIRGAGSAGTSDVAVPVYNDGLYRPRTSQGLASFIDVERVEILRGPQGTLFGRNTLGGLVNVITKKPDNDGLDYGAAISVGEYSMRKVEGFVNLPLGDTVALRISGTDTQRDPYVENIFNSEGGLKDADTRYLRAQLNFDISDSMNLNLTAATWRDNGNGAADFGHKVIGIPVNATSQTTDGINGFLDQRSGFRAGWEGGKDLNGFIGQDPSADLTDDLRTMAFDFTPTRGLSEDSFSGLFTADLGFAELKANIGYSDFTGFGLSDGDFSIRGSAEGVVAGGTLALTDLGRVSGEQYGSESTQADIQLTSLTGGALRWTLGYYTFSEDSNYGFVWGDTSFANPTQIDVWAHWLHGSESSVDSQAVYGQAEYDLTDQLTITGGLRYSEDERSSTSLFVDLATQGDALPGYQTTPNFHWQSAFSEKGDDSQSDYRIAAQYHINEDLMVFASSATGFITGGVDGTTGTLLDPSTTDALEIGVKSTLMDGAMTLNATAYSVEYTGLSTSFLEANNVGVFISRSVQGGGMESRGVEAELNWQATDELKIRAGVAFDFSEFTEFTKKNEYTENGGLPTIIAGTTEFFLLEGMDTPYSPDMTANLGITYQIDLGDMGHVVPGIFFYHSDSYQTTSVPYFWSTQDAYTTTDISATWYSPSDDFTVQAYINNASEEDVITGSDTFSGSRAVVDYNNPRTWGIRAAYKF